ncbi:MAG: IPT/TIG domain-containing protein [Bryobacteraceae bacterium]
MSVLTYHNDLARTGQNLSETELTPASVSSGQFGQLFSYPVDGQVYTQPLYMPGVIIPGKGIHNIVFVATEHDSVYAFDADNALAAPLWHTSFLNSSQGVTTASATELGCGSITPEIGVTGTPVIDPVTGTLYVVAMTETASGPTFAHWLHALDVTTGAERFGSPVEIQASVSGTGDGNTVVRFQPWLYKQRAGLLLLNGVVYTAWSSQCDSGNYHGWMIAYDAGTLKQTVTANGTFDVNLGGSDLAESILKLSTRNGITVADYFTPSNADTLSNQNLDLGSSGALLLPDGAGGAAHPNLLVIGSKAGTVYVVDRDHMGHFQAQGDSQIVQSLASAVGPLFGIPAYFNNTVYFSAGHDQLKAFALRNGLLSTVPVSAGNSAFGTIGTVPSISANGAAYGILWTIDPGGQLLAYDATDLAHQLYQGNIGSSVKFSTPTIANGKVYVGTTDSLLAFGLKDEAPGSIAAVVSAVGFQPGPFARGSNISLFGSNLTPRAMPAPSSVWPKVLEGTSVFVNGVAAPIGYVSDTQINAQIPFETKPGVATLTVVVGDRVLPPVEISVSKTFTIRSQE